jgi:hypothetical protein
LRIENGKLWWKYEKRISFGFIYFFEYKIVGADVLIRPRKTWNLFGRVWKPSPTICKTAQNAELRIIEWIFYIKLNLKNLLT